jgi:type IV secretion system protein VirB4
MFSADGVFPDTADDTDIAPWFDRLHNALKNIAAEDVELTVYQCRGEAEPSGYQTGLHPVRFARELDAAYRDSLFRGLLYANRLFLAVQVHAPPAAAQSVARFLADTGTDPRAGINERKSRLNEICDLLRAQLGTFGLRRLGYVRRGRVIFDEIAEAIVFAMTGTRRQIGATTGRMGHAMFSEALRFRRKHLEIHGPGDPAYAAMFAFKEYPATTWPGMFHGLAMAPYRCTLMQSYRFLSNAAGMGAVGRKQNKMLAAGDKALSQSEALTEAADELMSRKWVLGDHSLVLIAFADSPRAIAEVGNATYQAFFTPAPPKFIKITGPALARLPGRRRLSRRHEGTDRLCGPMGVGACLRRGCRFSGEVPEKKHIGDGNAVRAIGGVRGTPYLYAANDAGTTGSINVTPIICWRWRRSRSAPRRCRRPARDSAPCP